MRNYNKTNKERTFSRESNYYNNWSRAKCHQKYCDQWNSRFEIRETRESLNFNIK